MTVKNLMSCVAYLVVGFAAGWAAPREAGTKEPEFVTSGKVYDSQIAMLDRFVTAFKSKDADRCADLYSDDAVYMVPSLPAQVGNPAIRKGYVDTFNAMVESRVKELSEPIEQVVMMGD